MQTASVVDPHWPALLQRLSGALNLDASARASGALRRRRAVADGATLLRLALAHGPGGLSLRSAAGWAGVSGVAALSDVALRKRLRGAADWLGQVAGTLLRTAAASTAGAALLAGRRLRIVDGSSISSPGATGTEWRLHADYDPSAGRFTGLELTDVHGAEGFARLGFAAGDVALGDRGYARPRGLQHVLASGADFVVRVGWSSLRLTTPAGEPLDREPLYAALVPGEVTERRVVVTRHSRGPGRCSRPLFVARLIVMRQHAAASARALRATRRRHMRRHTGAAMQPLTATSTGYLMLLTSLPAEAASAAEVLATYRLRWQVELAFKRLKSGLGIDRLLARDERLARSWLLAHLILALLIEDAAGEILDAPPCAPSRPDPARLAVAAAHAVARCPDRDRAGGRGSHRPRPCGRAAGPPHLRPAAAQAVPSRIGTNGGAGHRRPRAVMCAADLLARPSAGRVPLRPEEEEGRAHPRGHRTCRSLACDGSTRPGDPGGGSLGQRRCSQSHAPGSARIQRSSVAFTARVSACTSARLSPVRGTARGGSHTILNRAGPRRTTRTGTTGLRKRSANWARAGAVMAVRPKKATGMPSFIFWSTSNPSDPPRSRCRSASRAPRAPFANMDTRGPSASRRSDWTTASTRALDAER
jgi:Transposase DDE domain